MDATKTGIRLSMRRQRRALSPDHARAVGAAVARFVEGLAAFRAAPAVLGYVATDNEVPTDVLLAAADAQGKRIFLPRLVGQRMDFAEHRPAAPMRPGPLGIPEPVGDPLADIDRPRAIALVPLLAWDQWGGRVGRGGGHYDRAFAGSERPGFLIGLGYEFQRVPLIPRDAWDLRLDAVATESGLHDCWAGELGSRFGKGVTDDDEIRGADSGQPGAGHGDGCFTGLPAAPPDRGGDAGKP
ncbi:MAG: 5-formyltetrahydrofolate cyclo-ligase [Candidatus Binatia bacterium]